MLIIGAQKEYIKNLIEELWVNIIICMFREIHYYLQTYSKTFKRKRNKIKIINEYWYVINGRKRN